MFNVFYRISELALRKKPQVLKLSSWEFWSLLTYERGWVAKSQSSLKDRAKSYGQPQRQNELLQKCQNYLLFSSR